MTRCAAGTTLENRAALFTGVLWGRVVVAFFLTAVLSLSVHAVMLQVFDVPYPSESISSPLPDIVNYAIASWASLWFFTRMRRAWPGHSPAFHAAILFVLFCGLNETLRGWFMNAYCTTSEHGWLFFALVALPKTIFYAATALLAALVDRVFKGRGQRRIAMLAMPLCLGLAAHPWVSWGQAALSTRFAYLMAGGGWCQLPYGMNVLVPAYLTFVEPALACLVLAAFAAPFLCRDWKGRAVQFTLLTLALKKQLFMAFFYAIYAPLPFVSALASMGQFSLEAAVLGFATALSWACASGDFGRAKLKQRTG